MGHDTLFIGGEDFTPSENLLRRVANKVGDITTTNVSVFLGRFFEALCVEILKGDKLAEQGENPDLSCIDPSTGKVTYYEVKLSENRNGNMIKKGQLNAHTRLFSPCHYVLGYYNQKNPAKIFSGAVGLSARKKMKLFMPHTIFIVPAKAVEEWYGISSIQEKPKLGVSHDLVKPLRFNEAKKYFQRYSQIHITKFHR